MPMHRIGQEEFHAADKVVTGLAFGIHNEFGRFCDEGIYQTELVNRCKAKGFSAASEVEIRVTHNTFSKSYFIDLLVDGSIIYELKTVKALNGEHRKQILNYMLLANLAHGALLNFRPASVVHEFASTMLTQDKRMAFSEIDEGWTALDKESEQFRVLMINLLKDWGAFLDSNLYTEAITHFFGGEEQVVTAIPVSNGLQTLGYQKVRLLNPETAFSISAATKDPEYYRKHLKRFLDHTDLKAIQWVNLNHEKIVFSTVT